MISEGDKREFTRAIIKTGYSCNNNCRFCDCVSLRNYAELSIKEVAKKVLLAKKQRYEMVIFSGGEPTLRADLPKLLALCKKVGIKCGLQTNGIRLANQSYTERLVKEGLSFVQLTLLSHQAETHNDLTQNKSHEHSLQAVKLLNKLKVQTLVNCVVTKKNKSDLILLAESLMQYAPLTFKAAMLNPQDIESSEIKQIVPKIQQAGKAVTKLVNWFENLSDIPNGFKIEFSGFPLCALGSYADKSYDLRTTDNSDTAEVYEKVFGRFEFIGRMKPGKCSRCRHLESCPGIYESYIEFGAEEELVPELGPVSNSFAYQPVKELADFDINKCPIRAGSMTIENPEQHILLQDENSISLYKTDSSDFDKLEINETKRKYGQIYLDVSGKVFHEDFEHDMLKLNPHQVCTNCEKFDICPALYVASSENVFTSAENELSEILGKLSGKVLDVGGGPILYAKELGQLIETKAIDYHVVEPDPNPSLITFLKKHDLESRYFKGMVEDFETEEQSFDWILVLRSHNHLFDLNGAYRKIAGWLKPGGKLLVVDNTVYGVLRSAEVWDKIKHQKGQDRFEHYNNHTSEQAIPYIVQANLKLIDQRPVTEKHANQWWCLFGKVD